MTVFKGPKERQADERRIKDIGPPADPAWWTPVRVEVMRALMRRSEIHVRMAGPGGPGREDQRGQRWRPHAVYMKTKHLFEGGPHQVRDGGTPRANPILTPQNVGPALRQLGDWGFIRRAPTAVAQVEFTIKGWAWLAAEGHIEPAWLELIFEKYDADRNTAWELYRKIRGSRKLHNLSVQYAGGLTEKAVADIMEPSPMTEDLPYVEPTDELPGLPQYDDEVEGILRERARDGDEVQRRRMQLARDFHHKTSGALSKLEPKELFDAIGRHFSSEEIVRADLEMIRAVGLPGETYFSRELTTRMSEAQEFKPRSLADYAQGGLAGVHGEGRIAAALEASVLREEGLARHMPGTATLGDVHDRLQRESVSAMGEEHETGVRDANTITDNGKPYGRDEAIADVISHGEDFRTALTAMRDNAAPATVDSDDPGYWQRQLNVLDRILLALDIATEPVPATPENIEAANAAAKAEDDALPMVDWIDRQISQHSYDGWVPDKQVGLIARSAVLRHMRQNPMGAPVSGEGRVTQYDGFRLHVRQRDYMAFEGRPCTLTMSVESDYDPADTEHVENWFHQFVEMGTKGMRGELVQRDDSFEALRAKASRHYSYPAGADVDHQVVGEIEEIKVRSINPLWMVAMMVGSSLTALILFVVLLSFLPIHPGA